VPVIYCYLDDLAAWAKRGFSAKPAPLPPLAPRVAIDPTK
jgi:hypothetical protein